MVPIGPELAQVGVLGAVAAWALAELRAVRKHKQELAREAVEYERRRTEAMENIAEHARRVTFETATGGGKGDGS